MDTTTYGQLAVFHTIAREQSISAAARKLGVTVPSVSKSLRLLEQKTGVPLFARTTRKISLTETGLALLSGTESAMAELDLALEEVLNSGGAPSGPVRITLPRFAWQLILQPLLAEFYGTYPDIQLEVSVNDGSVSLVEEGFDLGIRFGNAVSEGMVAREIFPPFRLGLYASEEYLARNGMPAAPDELVKHRLITYRFGTSKRISKLFLQDNGVTISPDMDNAMICNDIDVIRDAVSEGIGIGRLFEPLRDKMSGYEHLKPVLKNFWPTFPAVYLYYLPRSQRAKRVRATIDFIVERLNAKKG
ncbi:LysR family transcriptional regulator [Erwinia sp. JUb26]|uniref:LysR family transcriptional regulator n=1 Tax=Erwinia sp. JUb26 TaxID=2485126 RepID=UPI000F47735A|nr:LysR family transcriptional regulator [Erwinia sp. JUb26]ROR15032.1 LysR family transcriptional regulator [Erwinia sp. JUb26]